MLSFCFHFAFIPNFVHMLAMLSSIIHIWSQHRTNISHIILMEHEAQSETEDYINIK
jgi:hypothetical protein